MDGAAASTNRETQCTSRAIALARRFATPCVAVRRCTTQLKRSIDGTHHHVSREHLDRYLTEFDFRYSTRKSSDTERMAMVGQQAGGKRLTYRKV